VEGWGIRRVWLDREETSFDLGKRNPHFFERPLPILVAGVQIDTQAHGAILRLRLSAQNSGRPQMSAKPLHGFFLRKFFRGDALFFKKGSQLGAIDDFDGVLLRGQHLGQFIGKLHAKDGCGAGRTGEIGDQNRARALLAAGFIRVPQNAGGKIMKLILLLGGERKRRLRCRC
jgi:hypothetical protein